MIYSKSAPYTDDTSKAFEAAKLILLPNNYRIDQIKDNEISFIGNTMISTRQNPIVGATKITITRTADHINLSAHLTGVFYMILFVCLFPLAICLALALIFYFLKMGSQAVMVPFIVMIPYIGISPVMSYFIKKRTANALDTLLFNITITES